MIHVEYLSTFLGRYGPTATLIAIRNAINPVQVDPYDDLPPPQDPWARPAWDTDTRFIPCYQYGDL